jgi:2-C-methyl-D-erythritol 4-phosphate cytidylyltransferase
MSTRIYGLIPAAGLGARFGGQGPKQYSLIGTKTMLQHAVEALLAMREIETVFVILAPGDTQFKGIEWGQSAARVAPLFCGGATRRDSVLNGLIAAGSAVEPEDWVLVHDAARPCLALADLRKLVEVAGKEKSGGLLAIPVADTLKRDDGNNYVLATEPRQGLWQAQTPQMFPYETLVQALQGSDQATDEASAVERLGLKPRLVASSQQNLKVTYAADLELAAWVLATRQGA